MSNVIRRRIVIVIMIALSFLVLAVLIQMVTWCHRTLLIVVDAISAR